MAAVSGIDWASEWHDVDIADEHGTRLLAARFAHDERGVCALLAALLEHDVGRVAIERPDGLLVARLLAAGITVLAIHPNQVAAARDRFRAAAGKSDRFDAFVLRELGRTDHHRFPALAPCGDETLALRALVRTREDLVGARVAPANQLRAQLDAAWPGATRTFAEIDSPISLAFLARYPSLFRDPKRVITAAGLLAEIGDNRARYPSDDTLAADAGQAPVTKQSGKHHAVSFRWACDKRLRNHLGVLADSTRHRHPWAHDVYQRARDRGCDHPHALRILGRARTRILWRCRQDNRPYDPTQHRALTRHLATKG